MTLLPLRPFTTNFNGVNLPSKTWRVCCSISSSVILVAVRWYELAVPEGSKRFCNAFADSSVYWTMVLEVYGREMMMFCASTGAFPERCKRMRMCASS